MARLFEHKRMGSLVAVLLLRDVGLLLLQCTLNSSNWSCDEGWLLLLTMLSWGLYNAPCCFALLAVHFEHSVFALDSLRPAKSEQWMRILLCSQLPVLLQSLHLPLRFPC